MQLSPPLFWDTKIENLDFEKNAAFVIGRVLMRGTFSDWLNIKEYYGMDILKEKIKNLRYLDNKTLYFCHVYFNIPFNQFRCYNINPSIQKLWNY